MHISKIRSKVNAAFWNFYRRSRSLPLRIKILLVKQLVLSHFGYACVVYDGLFEYLDLKLLRLENQCIRFIYNFKKDGHITSYGRKLKWFTSDVRRKYLLGMQVFKILMFIVRNF